MASAAELLLVVSLITISLKYGESQLRFGPDLRLCPRLLNKVWFGYAPKGNKEAGVYKRSSSSTLDRCVDLCCENPNCNVVFMFNSTCYEVVCYSDALCEPVLREEENFRPYAQMVLVRPVSPRAEWDEVFEISSASDDLLMAATELLTVKSCEAITSTKSAECGLNEVCITSTLQPTTGVCTCQTGFTRAPDGSCSTCQPGYTRTTDGSCSTLNQNVTAGSVQTSPPSSSKIYGEGGTESSSQSPPKKIMVSVLSKQLRLPENEVTLSAYTVPAEPPGGGQNEYAYKWKLISQPEGSGGTMSETHGGTLKLSHLTEGSYIFKVTVTGTNGYGEAEANVTVLPQKRVNEPPVAIVLPPHQTVKLPNSRAILDASSSRDDDGIAKFHWELQQGPLGYQPNVTDTQTLQLNNLHKPGNYTFRLTITDTDGATNSTIANITVLQVPDYPPEANAGLSTVIYLPKNNVTLNGNLSSDDRGIVSWEWTKSPDDQDKAVDMQNTHTPYLQLSHLEEGMYTFVLKVTDDAGQSSISDVHVFVKPPTNKPPTADAGPDISIALPQTWVLLNGSHSSDDISIVEWEWEKISGPSKVSFSPANESVTNVTGLTKGDYKFLLTIMDGNDNIATDTVNVTVTQNKNAPPKANAGGDQTLVLPIDVLVINGSRSSDDLGIAKWQWTREPTSLAMGSIIGHSDTSPALMVTNVVAGRYEFRLRVTDDQGEWAEDTVSIIIKPDAERLNLVELTLNIKAGKLTQLQRDSVLLKLGLLLHDASQLIVRDLRVDSSGRAMLVFYVSSPTGSVPGPQVVKTLKDKLAQDSLLLHLSVANLQTAICQNNCSGHGVCEQETRLCLCEAFWMQDLLSKYAGDGESNCDWSILYVVIGLICLVILFLGCIWGVTCLCSRLFHHPGAKENMRYALLNSTEQVRLPVGKVIVSDSDTDSDVLFENRHGKTNGLKGPRNGFKSDRRVKT